MTSCRDCLTTATSCRATQTNTGRHHHAMADTGHLELVIVSTGGGVVAATTTGRAVRAATGAAAAGSWTLMMKCRPMASAQLAVYVQQLQVPMRPKHGLTSWQFIMETRARERLAAIVSAVDGVAIDMAPLYTGGLVNSNYETKR